mmetsp:Transcript_3786/g.10059  ORF Transcript_3786/g.10059 Transcript_3786/m.10059 type:complete len:215 (+) Transcript_3786:260-904(+)
MLRRGTSLRIGPSPSAPCSTAPVSTARTCTRPLHPARSTPSSGPRRSLRCGGTARSTRPRTLLRQQARPSSCTLSPSAPMSSLRTCRSASARRWKASTSNSPRGRPRVARRKLLAGGRPATGPAARPTKAAALTRSAAAGARRRRITAARQIGQRHRGITSGVRRPPSPGSTAATVPHLVIQMRRGRPTAAGEGQCPRAVPIRMGQASHLAHLR